MNAVLEGLSAPGPGPVWVWLLDSLLALGAAALAVGALSRPRDPIGAASVGQRRRVVLFMGFGLLLALIWARLGAVDVALAEAAIGAGFAGALLLIALRDDETELAPPMRPGVQTLITLLCLGLGLALAFMLWPVFSAPQPERLTQAAMAALPQTGVENPVTAVLLNLRAYDTLLELAVLLAAALGMVGLGSGRLPAEPPGEALGGAVHGLVPILLLTAGYLLWIGATAPGGAFQAGALLAAAGVILHLSGAARAGLPAPRAQAWWSVAGPGVFLLVGLATMALGGHFLEYRGDRAAVLILLIEGFAAISIGMLLIQAYLAGRAREEDSRR